jgi:hypothetical protein
MCAVVLVFAVSMSLLKTFVQRSMSQEEVMNEPEVKE